MRLHKLTHPTLGPITWKQLQSHNSPKHCRWCFELVPKGNRTRCNRHECHDNINMLCYWRSCVRRVMKASKHKCALCGGVAVEVDHIIPVSLGGTGDLSNLRALCSYCHKAETAQLSKLKDKFVARTSGVAPMIF